VFTSQLCCATVTGVVGGWRRIVHSRTSNGGAIPCLHRDRNAALFPASARTEAENKLLSERNNGSGTLPASSEAQ
jgi:hypothetical protein